jgi:hypothetical protein
MEVRLALHQGMTAEGVHCMPIIFHASTTVGSTMHDWRYTLLLHAFSAGAVCGFACAVCWDFFGSAQRHGLRRHRRAEQCASSEKGMTLLWDSTRRPCPGNLPSPALGCTVMHGCLDA